MRPYSVQRTSKNDTSQLKFYYEKNTTINTLNKWPKN